MSQDELAKIIEQTKGNLGDLENQENGIKEEEDEDEEDDEENEENEVGEDNIKEEEMSDADDDIEKRYGLDTYDDEDENADVAADLGNLVSFANPRDDPYLENPDLDDDQSDIEDMIIKPTDNLALVGHVEGNAAILEVYGKRVILQFTPASLTFVSIPVYNDVEDALYIHHDILLPSFPMCLEWLNFEPGEKTRSNLVAVGSMLPVIDVWDLDLIDSLEPAFTLGQKGNKKKKIPHVGHKDAVLSLAWNQNAE